LEAGTTERLLVEAILDPDFPLWIAEQRSERLPPKKGPADVAWDLDGKNIVQRTEFQGLLYHWLEALRQVWQAIERICPHMPSSKRGLL
jgi:hypothetical protein